jgi:hypothetical protein
MGSLAPLEPSKSLADKGVRRSRAPMPLSSESYFNQLQTRIFFAVVGIAIVAVVLHDALLAK